MRHVSLHSRNYGRRRFIWRGPLTLFASWLLHDLEEAIAFPSTCDYLAERSGIQSLRISAKQTRLAIGSMGVFVGFACWSGGKRDGDSRLYRAVVAGLEAHVGGHVAASIVSGRYLAGLVTAVPVMFPGARFARRELEKATEELGWSDYALGAALLIPGAVLAHVAARKLLPR